MTKSMKANDELNRIFNDLQAGYGKMNVKQQQFAMREFKRVQSEITDILVDSTGVNGSISRARYTTIQRQLAGIEKKMVQTGEIVMDKVVRGASKYATDGITDGFVDSFGASVGASLGDVNERAVEYVTKRFYKDGLVLSDRIWTSAANIHQAVEQEIRTGIITGMSVSEMIPRVRKAFDAETWQIKRLVKTEGMTAYRTTAAMAAEESEVVDWVQMHKGLADLPFHECTKLSLEDRYGEGAGIFKPTDTEVYNPHPNCTGFITYVVKDDYTPEGLRKRFGDMEDAAAELPTTPIATIPTIPKQDVRVFKTSAEVQSYQLNEVGDFILKLPKINQNAILSYTKEAYLDINKNLRFGTAPASFSQKTLENRVKRLKESIKGFVVDKPILVHRRIDDKMFEGITDITKLKGATITDKGFVSTSIMDGKFDFKSNTYHLKISVPSGKGHGIYIGKHSRFSNEHEFLLDSDSNFRVTDVKLIPGKQTIIEAELIPNENR